MEANIEKNNRMNVDAVVKRLNTEISDVVLQLQLIAGHLDEDAMYHYSERTISKSSIIHSIYFLNTSHHMKFEAPFLPHTKDITYDYPEFNHVRWSYTYVVSGLIRNPHDEAVVTVAVPVFAGDRNFRGVLIAELSREYLSEILKSMSVSKGGFGFLVDQTGNVIASTNKSVHKQGTVNFAVAQLLKGDSGTIKEDYLGKPSLITYQTMRENFGLVLGIPEEVAFQPISSLSKALTASYSVIFLLTICLIILGMRHILYPIVRLTRFAQQFNEKRSFQEFPELPNHPKDELGVLMKTLKTLAFNLEEKERFLHDIIEGIPYALITLDKSGVITHANEKVVPLTGYFQASLIGEHISVLPELAFIQNLPSETEITLLVQEQKRIVKVVTAPFYDGVLAVLQDITQLKLWEAHMKQSEKLALMGQITTGIAHELKNPLAILASSSELLKEELEEFPYSETVHTLAGDIDEEVKRMSSVVNEFLSFARLKDEETTWVEMDRLMDRVLHLLRIKLTESRIHVVRLYKRPIPPIKGKPNKLIQVFLNLLLNSIDAMPEGGPLEITIVEKNHSLFVTIQDRGHGISQQDLQWLFNPFFSTKVNGNGLGLTIARDIVREHGGDISVDSVIHKGTTVTCQFPLGPQEG